MRKQSLLPIDKLNVINTHLDDVVEVGDDKVKDDLYDEILELLILSYVYGTDSVNEDLGTEIVPDVNEMYESINRPVAGKTWEDRFNEYIKDKTPDPIKKVVDTESHRIYNEAQINAAKQSGLKLDKTWKTMLDEKVRDTHTFLEGVKIPLEEKFNTYDGDSASAPGGFSNADNNINCRCELVFSKRSEKGREDET